jgi:uncharacterized protein
VATRPIKLQVLAAASEDVWYSEGLSFTCTQCGNCCTGAPGQVWISIEEVIRLGKHLGMSPEQVVEKYCRKIGGKLSLRERRNPRGEYDCIFLEEQQRRRPAGEGEVTYTQRVCTIYPVRPLQCRTWPFWSENLKDRASWNRSARRCPGMGGGMHYSYKQILALRDAKDWPKRPPTSGNG